MTMTTFFEEGGDVVFLRGVSLNAVVGQDAWHRPDKLQPVVLDVRVYVNLTSAGDSDDVVQTVNYGSLYKGIVGHVTSKQYDSLKELSDLVVHLIFAHDPVISCIELRITLPKGLLLAKGIGMVTKAAKEEPHVPILQHLFVEALLIPCIIGVNAHERLEKQHVQVNITFTGQPQNLCDQHQKLIQRISNSVALSTFETLEALATEICKEAFQFSVEEVRVAVEKPSAQTFVAGSGVQITRQRGSFLTTS